MTKGEVMDKYGIDYISHTNREDEADDDFIALCEAIDRLSGKKKEKADEQTAKPLL